MTKTAPMLREARISHDFVSNPVKTPYRLGFCQVSQAPLGKSSDYKTVTVDAVFDWEVVLPKHSSNDDVWVRRSTAHITQTSSSCVTGLSYIGGNTSMA